MKTTKLSKLEISLARTIKDIRESVTSRGFHEGLKRYSHLEKKYERLTGNRYDPEYSHKVRVAD